MIEGGADLQKPTPALEWRKAASRLLELLFPGRCVLCGSAIDASYKPFYPVCASCLQRLPVPAGSRCKICSRSLISESGICITCRERNYQFAANTSAFEYRGAAKQLLAAFKFDNRRRVGMVIADLVAPLLLERGFPVVPVPGRKAALKARGWDTVWEICRLLERRYGLQIVRCLQRVGGAPQKALGFEARKANIAGQIRARIPPPARTVLLDDVFTTGATLDECARVLRRAGGREVYAVTFAID